MRSETKEFIKYSFGIIGFILTVLFIIFLLIAFLDSLSYGWEGQRVQFYFENDIEYKTVYRLTWIDHDLDRSRFPGPIEVAVGELTNGKSTTLTYVYRPGKYHITWKIYPSKVEIHVYFDVHEGVKELTIFPLHFESLDNEINKVPWWRNNWIKSPNVWEVISKENTK